MIRIEKSKRFSFSFKTLSDIEGKLKKAFGKIRDEFEEHLTAINENTNELSQTHEYLCELETKMDKLSERLDTVQLFLKNYGFTGSPGQSFNVKPLTTDEQRVFLAMYTVEDEKGYVSYADIGSALSMDIQLVAGYVASLIEKGVPLVKRYVNTTAYLRIDQDFKKLQTKENILQIDKAQKQLFQFQNF